MKSKPNTAARFPGLRSIKAKVSIFALMATLVPSVVLGLLHYKNSMSLLEDKISQGLQMTAEKVVREASQWREDRRSELRVFSQSYLMTRNAQAAIEGDPDARAEIITYLHSVLRMSPDVEGLAVFSLNGELVVSTDNSNWSLPADWGDAGALDALPLHHLKGLSNSLLMGVHTTDYGNEKVGFLAGRIHLRQVSSLLDRIASVTGESVSLIDAERRVVAHNDGSAVRVNDLLGEALVGRMEGGRTVSFWHQDGTEVVARMSTPDDGPWSVLAERDAVAAYSDINSFRRLTIIVSGSLMLVMAGIAYIFSTRTLAPLRRLTEGATEVASGDMNVRINVRGNDEIALLTRVFNNMMERLEEGRRQVDQASQKLKAQNRSLKVLSNTDSLTGLYNRQHLNNRLERLVQLSAEAQLPFAILMIDLDHFKNLNDRHGHVAGDQAIKLIAEHIRDTLRKSDYAARYGGEEFVVLLPKVDGPHAFELAERLRMAVASTPLRFDGNALHVTASIGVAAFPEHGRDSELLIRRADGALYEAKNKGRNQTVMSGTANLTVIPGERDSSA